MRLEIKNCNTRLIGKQQKYQHYYLEKLIKMSILLVKKLPFNQREIIEQAKFSYFPLGKDFEKQTEKLVNAINCLEISNKKMN